MSSESSPLIPWAGARNNPALGAAAAWALVFARHADRELAGQPNDVERARHQLLAALEALEKEKYEKEEQ